MEIKLRVGICGAWVCCVWHGPLRSDVDFLRLGDRGAACCDPTGTMRFLLRLRRRVWRGLSLLFRETCGRFPLFVVDCWILGLRLGLVRRLCRGRLRRLL